MRFLEDDMIRLRAVEPEDAATMWEMETDSSQWRENGMSAPFSRHNLEEYACTYDADPMRAGQIRLICEMKGEESPRKEIVGIADLFDISPTSRTAFVGIYIVGKHRKKGIAGNALRLLESYAGQLLNLRMLAAKASETNVASRRLFEKAGYSKSGQLDGWLLSGNTERTLLLYLKRL